MRSSATRSSTSALLSAGLPFSASSKAFQAHLNHLQTFWPETQDLRAGDLDAIWAPVTSPMFLDSTRTPRFGADPNAESGPGVVLHMPRARSHGVLRFSVA